MTKNQKKKLLISSSILAISALSIGSIVASHCYNTNINEDKTDLFLQNNSINSRSFIGSDVEWGQLVNEDSSISLPDSIQLTSYSPNAHVAVPGGIVLSTNKGLVFLNQNTLKIDWTIDSIGNTSQTAIFSSIYFNNKVYTLHMYDGGMRVTEIDPTNGTITQQSKKLTCNRASNNDFSYVLLPVQGTSDSIFIMPRGSIRNAERNASTYQFWVNKSFASSDNFINISFVEDSGLENNPKIVFAAGAWYNNTHGTFIARLERYYASGQLFLRVYKKHNDGSTNLFMESNLETPSINVNDYFDVTNHIPHICIANYNNRIEFEFFSNHNKGDNSKIYAITCEIANGGNVAKYTIDLQASGQDYDIRWGYYNSQIGRWVTLNTYTNENKYSVGIFKLGGLSSNQSFAPSNKSRVNLFYPGDGDLFKKWNINSGTFIPLITYGSGIDSNNNFTGDQNIFVFNGLQNSNDKYIVYNGSPYSNDQSKYPYAYETQLIRTPKFSSLNNINLKDIVDEINDDYVMNLFNENKEIHIKNYMKFTREDTSWKIQGVKPLTNENIYQGLINYSRVDYYNIYFHGQLQSAYWTNQFVGGFYVWNTTQLKTSIASDQELENKLVDPNHDNDSVYKDFIFKNKEQLFSDIPLEPDFSLDNIIIKKYDNSKANEMTIQFALNSHIVDGVLKSEEAPFTLTITDVPNISTEQKITSIEADASLNIYTPQQIANDIGTRSNLITTLTEFISNNKNKIFNNIPDDATFALDKGSSTSNIYGEVIEITNNSIKFKFSVRNIWINGIKETGWNDKTIKNFEITLTGLKTQEATKAKENAEIESGLNDILPVDWIANNSITQFLLDNLDKVFDNLPNKITNNGTALLVSDDNIQIVGDPVPNNLDGTVTVTIKLNKYFDEQGMLYDGGSNFDNALEHTIKIIGFESRKPTTVNNIIDITLINSTPVDWIDAGNSVEDLVFENIDKIFNNLPKQFTKDNVVVSSNVKPINNKGQLIVNVTINKYIDSKGDLIEGVDFGPYTITINGFLIQEPTSLIHNELWVNGVNKKLKPSEITLDVLSEIISNNGYDSIFKNLPKDTQINITQILEANDNKDANLKIEISVSKYYDENGELVNQEKLFQLNIKGFHSSIVAEQNNYKWWYTPLIVTGAILLIALLTLVLVTIIRY